MFRVSCFRYWVLEIQASGVLGTHDHRPCIVQVSAALYCTSFRLVQVSGIGGLGIDVSGVFSGCPVACNHDKAEHRACKAEHRACRPSIVRVQS